MIKLGVIGLSEGNGHPYSWTAIINGYDQAAMEDCGFPVIPRYLEANNANGNRLPGAEVTHVWTQDPALSRKVAAASRIGTIVENFEDMVGQVDAILLARADAENHPRFAAPFLAAGMPIFVDKPFALNLPDAQALLALQRYPSQIYTCTALRHGHEFASLLELAKSGQADWTYIRAVTPKIWSDYAIHIVEPVVRLLAARKQAVSGEEIAPTDFRDALVAKPGWTKEHQPTYVQVTGPGDIALSFSALGKADTGGMRFEFFGPGGVTEIVFKDSYYAFKAGLAEFLAGIADRETPRIPRAETLTCMHLLGQGNA